MRLAIVTPSFARDHALCVELCRSLDRHNLDAIEHVVVVPRRDQALFAHLACDGRRIMAQEELLPSSLVQVPFPPRIRIPSIVDVRVRTLWLTGRLRPVRGWLLQQVVKLTADRASDADAVVFCDSDVVFVRDFTTATFVRGGRPTLHHEPDCIDHSLERYQAWQDVACRLLGVATFPYRRDNYIAPVLCWRMDRLRELQKRIETTTGRDHREALLSLGNLSEYVLYGVYCDEVLRAAGHDDGHERIETSHCLEDWNFDLRTGEGLDAFMAGLRPHHIGVLMQSTNDWSVEERRAAVRRITGALHG